MMYVPHDPEYTPLEGVLKNSNNLRRLRICHSIRFFDLQPKSPDTITPAASSPTSKINFSFKYDTTVQHDFAKTRYADAADFTFFITN